MEDKIIFNGILVDSFLNEKGALLLKNGLISKVLLEKKDSALINELLSDSSLQKIDAKGLSIMPSFVDMHAHFRYPGQSQKETLDCALKAASAGGFGTLVLMPNTSPIVSSKELALSVKKEAEELGLAEVFQTMSLTKDFAGSDTSHLDCVDSSMIPVVSEDGCDVESSFVMLEAMKKCNANNLIISCHCEDVVLAKQAKVPRAKAAELKKMGIVNQESNSAFLCAEKLLATAEDIATSRNLFLAEDANCQIHIAHVSTKRALDCVRDAKKLRGGAITCEATPHHIALCSTAECVMQEFVNPPIRNKSDKDAIIAGIKDGSIDMIATDHAPHSVSDKENGACGFTGLETAFSVCYTFLVKTGEITLNKLSELMSYSPSKRLKLNKGLLKEGMRADLVFVDTTKDWQVKSEEFFSKGKHSPFDKKVLTGKIEKTFFAAKEVFSL